MIVTASRVVSLRSTPVGSHSAILDLERRERERESSREEYEPTDWFVDEIREVDGDVAVLHRRLKMEVTRVARFHREELAVDVLQRSDHSDHRLNRWKGQNHLKELMEDLLLIVYLLSCAVRSLEHVPLLAMHQFHGNLVINRMRADFHPQRRFLNHFNNSSSSSESNSHHSCQPV